MSFILIGKKIGMTQVYDSQNRLLPVTVIEAGPCHVTQVKTADTDGYEAVQIGFGPQKASRVSKPVQGHVKKAGVDPVRILREFRNTKGETYETGQALTVDLFSEGDRVDVIATSKGHGFQGVMKRHGFAGGPASHGSMTHRRGGSYGLCQDPGRVMKGKKMPGHMGATRRTVVNLDVVKVLPAKNVILVKGSLPGANGSVITIRPAKKQKRAA